MADAAMSDFLPHSSTTPSSPAARSASAEAAPVPEILLRPCIARPRLGPLLWLADAQAPRLLVLELAPQHANTRDPASYRLDSTATPPARTAHHLVPAVDLNPELHLVDPDFCVQARAPTPRLPAAVRPCHAPVRPKPTASSLHARLLRQPRPPPRADAPPSSTRPTPFRFTPHSMSPACPAFLPKSPHTRFPVVLGHLVPFPLEGLRQDLPKTPDMQLMPSPPTGTMQRKTVADANTPCLCQDRSKTDATRAPPTQIQVRHQQLKRKRKTSVMERQDPLLISEDCSSSPKISEPKTPM